MGEQARTGTAAQMMKDDGSLAGGTLCLTRALAATQSQNSLFLTSL
jgi:hypothetical protein